MSDWNQNVIDEFRANDGKVGGVFEGAPLLILHTKGARSGKMYEVPLMYREEEGRYFVFASKGGAPTHPAWYHNLVANPALEVELPGTTLTMTASLVDEPDRSEVFARQAAEWPQFGAYQEKTDRVIPVFELVATS